VKTWIALVRGINVGGRTLRMKDLIARAEESGCTDVKAYVQSGNLVLRSSVSSASALAKRIEQAIGKRHGFEPRTLVLSPKELEKVAQANPFKQAQDAPASLHLFFLFDQPKKPDFAGLNAVKIASESFALDGKVFYLHTPDGLGRSKLAQKIVRCLAVDATARNWRTVTALLELAGTPQGP
jgi:uncharacterized protein (DUF1697 family)